MSDRRRVVYKTPLHRFFEISLILAIAAGAAMLWQSLLPGISPSYPIVAALALGIAVVPVLGSRVAIRRGAPLMTREERTRRYLSELGPFGPAARPRTVPVYGTARRSGGRSLRRG